ncbi:multiubiquitin domain-containing protein [Jiella pelagia]|uniref:Multiubiquitin domain-containing protein n=1 Tax=Jiella pelagia TaxID=2986949 RepID=A0ABY7BT79_9HYPH|nr:multiubiquitin domain-containing protein [Jiella pelagia]WAP66817.1 multiubiquitin domain-containing protein [Jiella pelagia]
MAAEQNGHDGAFRISVGDADLNFRPVRIDDPVPTGRQILEAAGVRIPEEHLVFQILRDGEARRAAPGRNDRPARRSSRTLPHLSGGRVISDRGSTVRCWNGAPARSAGGC